MSKYIFVDIDGTLLDHKAGGVPASSAKAIAEARNNGHKVFICTGRPRNEVDDTIKSIGFDGFIYSSGGCVEIDNNIIFQQALDKGAVEEVVGILERYQMGYFLEATDCTFFNDKALELFYILYMDGMEIDPELARNSLASMKMKSVDAYKENKEIEILKLLFFSDSAQNSTEVKKLLPACLDYITHDMGNTEIINGEIFNKEVTKATGVDAILNYFGGSREETIAFGDSPNDKPMILHCNMGVCMGNGVEELKEVSDYVCKPIYEDGLSEGFKFLNLI